MNFNLIKKKLFSKKILSNENKSIPESNMKFYIVNGMLFTIMTCLYKSFADKFITRLGGTSLHISLYNALPGLMGAFCMLPGIIIMSKASNKKRLCLHFF
ncbi:hypothetical protein ACFIJ5_16165 [Haloimpatiens sp. FM7330]|uniref:hypothetical protein n=1 Tax=Haloimpatiens sp. FM7330 TaxID=3298610 RepID=UPI00362F326B